jgi:hypothetical protein
MDCAVNFYHYDANCKACPPEEIKWITLFCGLSVVLFIYFFFILKLEAGMPK